MIKYSVIIPVYNSEKTLERCLNSLTLQNRKDVQIIVVNDGSKDGSDAIIRNYAARYPGIEYIFQENAGVSAARNAGLDAAKGQYITFVDGDDYVNPNYFDVLDNADDSDLLVFPYDNVGGQPLDETALFVELSGRETTEEKLVLLLASRKIMSPCNKRFRAELVSEMNLRFLPNIHIGEDFNFCMAYAVCCQSINVSCERILCVDISNQDSLSRKYRPALDRKLKIVFENIVRTVCNSALQESIKMRLLAVTDYLFVKHVFSCISEEFKKKKLNYLKDRRRICEICEIFQHEISEQRVGFIHRCLRFALKLKLYYPFYLVSYWVKGRKYLS